MSDYHYKRQIDNIVSELGETRWGAYEEAKDLLGRLRDAQRDLRALKKEVNHDMKGIRSRFAGKRAGVGKDLGTVAVSLVSGKRAAGRMNAAAKEQLRREKEAVLEPYVEAKRVIDDLIHRADKGKDDIQQSPPYKNRPKRKRTSTRKPSSSMLKAKEKRYYAHLGDEVKGPFNLSELEGLVKAGVANSDTKLCAEGEDDWHAMSHFFEC